MQDVVVIGCGYTGMRLATRLRDAGYHVTGTARSDTSLDAMRDAGIRAVTGALNDERTVAQLAALEPVMVAYFVPPQRSGEDPLRGVMYGLRQSPLEAFVYASATSVYGDHDGEWVDEDTAVTADGIANTDRIEAERLVQDVAGEYRLPARICRISGIYGPGRTLKGLLASGRYTLIHGHDTWVGRIHVDDLVTGIIAAWQRGQDGRVYNMVDERPHRASEFANLAAKLNGLPRPLVIQEAEARERYRPAEFRRKTSNKRIRCGRLIGELGVRLQYPSFEQGLPAAVATDQERK